MPFSSRHCGAPPEARGQKTHTGTWQFFPPQQPLIAHSNTNLDKQHKGEIYVLSEGDNSHRYEQPFHIVTLLDYSHFKAFFIHLIIPWGCYISLRPCYLLYIIQDSFDKQDILFDVLTFVFVCARVLPVILPPSLNLPLLSLWDWAGSDGVNGAHLEVGVAYMPHLRNELISRYSATACDRLGNLKPQRISLGRVWNLSHGGGSLQGKSCGAFFPSWQFSRPLNCTKKWQKSL